MTIVVGSDRSERASRVLPHAAALARGTRQPLLVLSVLERIGVEPLQDDQLAPEVERRRALAVADLEQALASAGGEAEVLVRVAGEDESTAHAIVRLAVDHGAMALALSSRGANLARHAMLGSVAMEVVRSSHLPVLLVTDRAASAAGVPDGSPYTIVCGLDGSPHGEDMVRALGPLLQETEARLVFARIDEWATHDFIPDGRRDALAAQLRRAGRLLPSDVAPDFVVAPRLGLDVPDALIALAQEGGAHAIALATHGHRASRRVFAGSDALAVLERSPLPVFLTHGAW